MDTLRKKFNNFVNYRINEKDLTMETKLKADSGGGLVSSVMVRL